MIDMARKIGKTKASHIFMVAGIKNLLKRNYKIDTDLIDVDALVDDQLTFNENWNNIKSKCVKPKLQEATA